MLRFLSIITVLFAVVQAPDPVFGQTADKNACNCRDQYQPTDESKHPSSQISSDTKIENTAPRQNQAQNHTPTDNDSSINITNPASMSVPWTWHEKVAWLINIVLAIAIGLYFAWGTVKATQNAAKAALLNAKAMRTAERAWFVIKASKRDWDPLHPARTQNPSFRWRIRNCGRTPGKIIATQVVFENVLSEYLTDLAQEPVFPSPIERHEFLLPPNASIEHTVYLVQPPEGKPVSGLSNGDVMQLKMRLRYLGAYGYVRYIDVFGKTRESRFCEYFVPWKETILESDSGFQPLLGIPAAYTKHT